MAESKKQIDVLFGVKGGADINGASGRLIAKQLRDLAKNLKVEFTASLDTAKAEKQIAKQLKSVDTSHLKALDSVTKYLQKYGDAMSASVSDSYKKMTELSEKLRSGAFTGNGSAAQQEFNSIAANARSAGSEVETLGQKIKQVIEGKGTLSTLKNYISKGNSGIFGTDELGSLTIFGKTKKQRETNQNLAGLYATESTPIQETLGGFLRPHLDISDEELNSLRAFNAEIENGTSQMQAQKKHLSNCSEAVNNLALGLKSGKIAMKDIEVATVGASTAMTVFKSIANFGLELLASAAITAVSALIDKYTNWQNKIDELDHKISDSKEKISLYQTEIDSLTSVQEKLTAAKGNKEELVKVQGELNKLLGAAPDLINGEANAYDQAQQAIKDQISINETMLKEEQERKIRLNKEKFEAAKVVATGAFGWDWTAWDINGSDARKYAKNISKMAQSYAETFKVSYQEAYGKVLSYRKKLIETSDGVDFWAADDDVLEKRFSGKELEWAKKQSSQAEGIAEEWAYTVSESNWEEYWKGQVDVALDTFEDTIDNYNGYGGAQFIRTVIESMVRDGFTLDEINTQINNPTLEALKGTYFTGLVDELKNARAKGDTDAAAAALENIKAAINNLKNVCPSATTYLNAIWNTIANGTKKTEEATNSIESFTDKIKGITTANKDVSSKQNSIANMLAELRDDGGLSADSMATIVNDFSGVEGYENYLRILTSSTSSIKEQQDALNGLYGAYIDQSGMLDGLTEETSDFIETQLKARGVTNAHNVVISRLTKKQLAEGKVLENITDNNYEYIKSQFEANGIINATDVAALALASSLTKAAIEQGTLTEETAQSIKQKLLEKGASETVANQYMQSAKACISAQQAMSQGLTEEVAKRIKNMGIELSAMQSYDELYLAIREKAAKNGDRTRWDAYVRQGGGGAEGEYNALKTMYGQAFADEMMKYKAQCEAAAKAKADLDKLLSQVTNGESKDISVDPTKTTGESTDSHKKAFDDWYTKLKWQRDNNIIDETNFLQQLDSEYKHYYENRADYLEEYAKYSQEVYDGFKKLYQDDRNAQKEALEEQKNDLKELADARKQALEDAKEEEDYKKDQAEKRNEINKLESLIAQFSGKLDLSAQKKVRELQSQLKEKQDELAEFENDKALERAKEQIDKEYESQEKAINEEIKGIEFQLEQINKDLPDIRDAVISFAQQYGVTITRAYASGTSSVPAVTQENGAEIIAGNIKRGQFTMLTPTSKVWNASATQVLWDFANSPHGYLSSMMDKISSFKQKALSMIYSQTVNVNVGGITVNGNADGQTVQKIRNSQKEQVKEMLKAFKKLQ